MFGADCTRSLPGAVEGLLMMLPHENLRRVLNQVGEGGEQW